MDPSAWYKVQCEFQDNLLTCLLAEGIAGIMHLAVWRCSHCMLSLKLLQNPMGAGLAKARQYWTTPHCCTMPAYGVHACSVEVAIQAGTCWPSSYRPHQLRAGQEGAMAGPASGEEPGARGKATRYFPFFLFEMTQGRRHLPGKTPAPDWSWHVP